ncbi:phosphate regulon transcriptional regulator PhoB [Ameyamaea chiangmaiensis]|uniref:Phosphate regulon transcriptional regulatory protein PhoB n=2 Tax=Ameyamaea chiangmaiensis TaxID=442969 RepID=A0A850PKE3_9PROT|nr:phosphate regulon transcriptional regulator PhoB [Ameyamaea chiangmaiensis]MBS4074997.1 phosphate regulon transcriptional regulator PhoB [Ameyamaea chiangmaiensis]NVN42222.1 phosphate regulon transcriptional regulator PhoB [Ameyamaea chiangmaiensis]
MPIDVPTARGTILLVEDDAALLLMVRYNLEKAGYEVDVAADAREAFSCLSVRRPDLILLDWMLPDMNGVEICRRIRLKPDTAQVPIIMLTARTDEQDTIRGLDSGADDYITKPCSMQALDARIRALLRRAGTTPEILTFEDVTLDTEKHRVERNGRLVALGPTEYRFLDFFLRNPRRVFSREDLLRRIWGERVHVEPRTVDVHIRRLRQALNAEGDVDLIRTVRAAGYAFDTEAH